MDRRQIIMLIGIIASMFLLVVIMAPVVLVHSGIPHLLGLFVHCDLVSLFK